MVAHPSTTTVTHRSRTRDSPEWIHRGYICPPVEDVTLARFFCALVDLRSVSDRRRDCRAGTESLNADGPRVGALAVGLLVLGFGGVEG